jgi:hypothetical protein
MRNPCNPRNMRNPTNAAARRPHWGDGMGISYMALHNSFTALAQKIMTTAGFDEEPPDLSSLQCGTVRKPPEAAGCLWYVLEPGSS